MRLLSKDKGSNSWHHELRVGIQTLETRQRASNTDSKILGGTQKIDSSHNIGFAARRDQPYRRSAVHRQPFIVIPDTRRPHA